MVQQMVEIHFAEVPLLNEAMELIISYPTGINEDIYLFINEGYIIYIYNTYISLTIIL